MATFSHEPSDNTTWDDASMGGQRRLAQWDRLTPSQQACRKAECGARLKRLLEQVREAKETK